MRPVVGRAVGSAMVGRFRDDMDRRADGESLRHFMRRVPCPVTVVTAANADEMRGITIGSFTSVSLDPPLICFNVARDAQMHDLIVSAPRFAVHLLGSDQAVIANHFAIPDLPAGAQFESVSFATNEFGLPILDEVLAVVYCNRYAVYDAGDHSLILGEVTDIQRFREGTPLLYFDRTYREIGAPLRVSLLAPVKSDAP
jgi:3-hydroxy-9,10-secoandrosta-1,3,5(10)-triene-9,17-dione monooxygenase reductase component